MKNNKITTSSWGFLRRGLIKGNLRQREVLEMKTMGLEDRNYETFHFWWFAEDVFASSFQGWTFCNWYRSGNLRIAWLEMKLESDTNPDPPSQSHRWDKKGALMDRFTKIFWHAVRGTKLFVTSSKMKCVRFTRMIFSKDETSSRRTKEEKKVKTEILSRF